MIQQAPPSIIVRVVEQPVHETTLSDVILGSLGVVGVLLVCAVVLGLVLGAAMILVQRIRRRDKLDPRDDAEHFRVTPT